MLFLFKETGYGAFGTVRDCSQRTYVWSAAVIEGIVTLASMICVEFQMVYEA